MICCALQRTAMLTAHRALALPRCLQPLSLEELLKKKKQLEEEASKVSSTPGGMADNAALKHD